MLIEIERPKNEPVSLREAKAICRVDHAQHDERIEHLRNAARRYVEMFTRRRLITQKVQLRRSGLGGVVELPVGPVQAIEEVTYLDTAGASQVLAADQYRLDRSVQPNRMVPAHLVVWPSILTDVDTVGITLRVGYGDDGWSVPDEFREAILKLVAYWYDAPEAVLSGTIATEMPLGVRALLAPHVIWV